MKIEYFGHACFKITDKNGVSVVTDPYTRIGYELPENFTADIVTVSHSHFDHNYIAGVSGNPEIITDTSTKTVKGIEIEGVFSWHDGQNGLLRGENRIYKLKADGITLCHLGDLGEEVTENLVEKIGKVDVLCIPIGATYTINASQAKAYIEAIQPKMVIPMHYKLPDCTIDITDEKPFLRLFSGIKYAGGKAIEIEEFSFTKETQIVVMERGK